MNCDNFNDRLPEYLEGTLSAADQAAAREHVQKCGACQQAMARQEGFAKSIRLAFNLKTQGLSLRPETKRNILNALKRHEFPPTVWENIQAFIVALLRHPARAAIVLLCLVLLISGGRFYLGSTHRSSVQAAVKDDRITYVIDVPIQTQTHFYRRQNNMVVDAVVAEVSVIDASISEKLRSSPSPQPHINQEKTP